MNSVAPVRKETRFKPWLWPIRIIARFWNYPVQPGLWIINKIFQSILDINNNIPWMVHFSSRVSGRILIGKDVWLSFAVSGGCYIQGSNGIEIGDNTIFAPGVKIISGNHDSSNLKNWLVEEPVRIGKNCWLGANSVILPGVQLGDNVIVGAGSIVTKNFDSNCVIAGNPARLIRKLEG
jgi:acetyltransferase-like isoleucine patch superfamily enzyme